MSACPAPGCGLDARPGQLACRGHWFALPKPLRDAIYDTWRRRRELGMGPYSANVMAAREFWAGGAQ